MSLKEKLQEDLKEALKGGRADEVLVLRMILASISNMEIEKRGKGENSPLNDEEVTLVLQKELKKRNEAKEAYRNAERNDLADKEQMEARVIEKYLPKALSREELEEMVSETLSSVEKKEFGEVMKKVMEKTKGRADGKMVGEIVKSKISDLK